MKLENPKRWAPEPTSDCTTPNPRTALVIRVLTSEDNNVEFFAVSNDVVYCFSLNIGSRELAQFIAQILEQDCMAMTISEVGSLRSAHA